MRVPSLGQEDPLEEGMATHSRIVAWRIPWTEEPGRLHSMVSQSWTRLKQLSMHSRQYSLDYIVGQGKTKRYRINGVNRARCTLILGYLEINHS